MPAAVLWVWGSQSASGPGRGAKFLGLALDHKFIFTYQEQEHEHCSQLFTEPELPLDTKSRINDKHIFCFWGQCKQRYFAFATTKFCKEFLASPLMLTVLFLPPSCASCSYWPALITSQRKKSRNKAFPYQIPGTLEASQMCALVFWGHAWRKAQMDRAYIWFNLDAPVKSRTTSDVKHSLKRCVLEGEKSFSCSTFLSPYCILMLTPFPPLFSSAYLPLCSYLERSETQRAAVPEGQNRGEITWNRRAAVKKSLCWFPSLLASHSKTKLVTNRVWPEPISSGLGHLRDSSALFPSLGNSLHMHFQSHHLSLIPSSAISQWEKEKQTDVSLLDPALTPLIHQSLLFPILKQCVLFTLAPLCKLIPIPPSSFSC